jgi:hypothetical protein
LDVKHPVVVDEIFATWYLVALHVSVFTVNIGSMTLRHFYFRFERGWFSRVALYECYMNKIHLHVSPLAPSSISGPLLLRIEHLNFEIQPSFIL